MRRRHLLTGLALIAMLALGMLLGRRFDPLAHPAPAAHPQDASVAAQGENSPTHVAKIAPTQHTRSTTALSGAATRASALPPAGSPLKAMLADLQSRADEGDANAASRLYRDLHRCAAVLRANQTIPTAAQHFLNEKSDKMSPDELKSMNTMLGMLDDQLKFARDNTALCADIESSDLDALVPATLQAALLGDDKAANCYLGSDLVRQPGLLDHPEWLVDFKQNALNIANAAVAHGDWTAVKQLTFAYKGAFSGSLLSQAIGLDAAQAYRYRKLWRLGVDAGKNTAYLDTELDAAARQLAPDSIASGDAWAQDMYRRFFSGVPVDASGSINVCQLRDM